MSVNIVLWLLVVLASGYLFVLSTFTLGAMLWAWRDYHRPVASGAAPEGKLSFTLLVPARHEEAVIGATLDGLASLDHPDYEVLVIVGHDDPGTAQVAEEAAARHPGIIRVIVDYHEEKSKPKALNTALEYSRGDVIGIFDAEDVVHPGLLRAVERTMLEDRSAAVQAGVQLVNFWSKWYTLRNTLEYYFWFRSRLVFQGEHDFIPLGGNTVFMRRRVVCELGGWDSDCLAEDCEIGVRLSSHGLPVSVIYDPEIVTREEAPVTVKQFIKQRTRWNQGFIQVLRKGEWRRLPERSQRMLAVVTLLTPFLIAFSGPLLLLSLGSMFFIPLPDGWSLLTFMPVLPMLATLFVECVGLHDLGQIVGRRPGIRHYLFLLIGLAPYQALLIFAAVRACWRMAFGRISWEKTAHIGAHLQVPATGQERGSQQERELA